LTEGTMLVGLHTTWSAPQAKNPSYAPAVSPGQWVIFSAWVTGSPGHHYDPVCDPVFFYFKAPFCSM